MPMYTYRCSCGKSADVLVRGREPTSCDEVRELAGACDGTGTLSRQLSAPYVARGGATSRPSTEAPSPCDHCSNPGACGIDA